MNKTLRGLLIAAAWLGIWELLALRAGSPLLLAGPWDTATALAKGLVTAAFWKIVGVSLLHIALGLLAACILGCAAGALAGARPGFAAFFRPAVQVVAAAPIVCVIVALLALCGSRWVDVAAVMLAVFPVYYFALAEGWTARNPELREMLRVFRVPAARRLAVFDVPALMPYFRQATKTGVGMSWKAGVAAQLVAYAANTIGGAVYGAKLTLASADLLAWTAVTVLLGWASQRAVLAGVDAVAAAAKRRALAGCGRGAHPAPAPFPAAVSLQNVTKRYGETVPVDSLTCEYAAGSRTVLTLPTGSGKTTLLRLIMSLEAPDAGTVETNRARFSAVFQETRLLPALTATENVMIAADCTPAAAREALSALLPEACLDALPDQLSGGQRRLTELARALTAPSDAVTLDEPFTGLDAETHRRARAYIDERLAGRTLFAATHV